MILFTSKPKFLKRIPIEKNVMPVRPGMYVVETEQTTPGFKIQDCHITTAVYSKEYNEFALSNPYCKIVAWYKPIY